MHNPEVDVLVEDRGTFQRPVLVLVDGEEWPVLDLTYKMAATDADVVTMTFHPKRLTVKEDSGTE